MGAATMSHSDEYRVVRPLGRSPDTVFLAHDRKLDWAGGLHLLPPAPAARGARPARALAGPRLPRARPEARSGGRPSPAPRVPRRPERAPLLPPGARPRHAP